eukprot:6191091-Pleurochrysis_carterae.AAC.1
MMLTTIGESLLRSGSCTRFRLSCAATAVAIALSEACMTILSAAAELSTIAVCMRIAIGCTFGLLTFAVAGSAEGAEWCGGDSAAKRVEEGAFPRAR